MGTFLFCPSQPAYAADPSSGSGIIDFDDEMRLFDLINSARKDPLGVAESLGMDRNQILKDFPELTEILTQGLPLLTFNDCLYQSAGGHSRDMMENGYYAYESLDGKTAADRMKDAGYVPAVSGESLGLLSFNNYITPEKAVSQIFENIYKDELNPQWIGERNILNPDVKDLAVGMVGGLYNFNGYSGNVYLATCDFGAAIAVYELEMVQMVNHARTNPRLVAESFGMDVNDILKDFPELATLFSKGIPPVMVNSQLYASATGHAKDMMENGYYGLVSPDGSTPVMRIRASGYKPFWGAESLARVSTCNVELPPAETISRIFKQMFTRAFRADKSRDQNMFSDRAADAGISVIPGASNELGGICGNYLQLSVADYGLGKIGPDFALIGVIFDDANGNNLVDPGEGIPGLAVSIRAVGSSDEFTKIITDPAGGFSTRLPDGRYRVSATGTGLSSMVRRIEMNGANMWLPMAVKKD